MPLLKVRPKVIYDDGYLNSRASHSEPLEVLRARILQGAPALRELGFYLDLPDTLGFERVEILEHFPRAWNGNHIDREVMKNRFWTWYYSEVTEQQKKKYDILLYFTNHYFGVTAYGGGHILGGFPRSRLVVYGDHPHVICHEILHLLGAGHADVNEFGHNVMEKSPAHHDQDAPMVLAQKTFDHIELSRTKGYYDNLEVHVSEESPPPEEPKYTMGQVIEIANYMFRNGPRPMLDIDANRDGVENMYDILYVLNEMFGGDDEGRRI